MKFLRIALALFVFPAMLPGQADFLKPFGVDSFVYSSATQKWTYFEAPPKHSKPHFLLESSGVVKCPICRQEPLNRTRATIEPFGSKVTFSFWHDRVQFSASVGGTEWWRQDGFNPLSGTIGGIQAQNLKRSERSFQFAAQHPIMNDQYNDQWLLQSHLTARVFLDSEKDVSVGVTRGYFYNNLNPLGTKNWSSTTVDLTITFKDVRSIRKVFRKKHRRAQ